VRIRLEFKPQDLWIGAFWRRSIDVLDVWVCLIPCLPIHLRWAGRLDIDEFVRWKCPYCDRARAREDDPEWMDHINACEDRERLIMASIHAELNAERNGGAQ
jgi:hypothetical protein